MIVLDIHDLVGSAEMHGETSGDVRFQIDDLELYLGEMWDILTDGQKQAFRENIVVQDAFWVATGVTL